MEDNHDIVPAHLAIQAMRDNGYKNTAYAIAELIDNAIEAEAKNITLLCIEDDTSASRSSKHVSKIAIIDDGIGMDKKTLRISLQFGNGTRLDPANQKGIGKFGMGLPASSISQCLHVGVWSWQNGIKNALYTYLDIQSVRQKSLTEIPIPIKKEIPSEVLRAVKNFGESGTLVLWDKLDRVIWKTAKGIFNNSEFLIGRLYRNYISKKDININFVSINLSNSLVLEEKVLPNDPLYLMKKTSCPAPYTSEPMFEKWGDDSRIHVKYNGKNHIIKVKYSIAKSDARKGESAGSKAHGNHARKNVGISIVRSGREIELDQSWVIQYDPMERWWGIEIDFPSELDELMGLTNNKQYTSNFSHLKNLDFEEIGRNPDEYKRELEELGDPVFYLIELASHIKNNLNAIRRQLKAMNKGSKAVKSSNFDEDSPEKIATLKTREGIEQGEIDKTKNDEIEETINEKKRKELIKQELKKDGLDDEDAEEISLDTIEHGLKYIFNYADLDTQAFFTVKPMAGTIIITLNTNHPAYDKLYHVVDENDSDIDDLDIDELKKKIKSARNGLKLLLEAWARYEDSLMDGQAKQRAKDARFDWGRLASRFMSGD